MATVLRWFIGSIEQTLHLHETTCKTHYFANKKCILTYTNKMNKTFKCVDFNENILNM